MFNAIDSDDYNFKFTDNTGNINQFLLNASLNRIKEIMTSTKQKAIEREKYYELIMNGVTTGIITINENGNIYQVNKESLKIFGISVLTHINQLRIFNELLPQVLMHIKPGEIKKLSIYNESGEMQLAIGASSIIYDNKKLKIISINNINKALDEKETETWIKLTRVLTHEIMNSLAPVTSLSETLIKMTQENCPENESDIIFKEKIAQGLETISSTSKSLVSFVDSYRKFTRIQQPVNTTFEILPLLESSTRLAKELFNTIRPGSNIEMNIDINPTNILIYGDENLIRQVIMNLLKNAIQAIDTKYPDKDFKGRIDIGCHIMENEEVEINISNNGDAIPAKLAEDIFTPFFTTKEHGTGVGLSVSRQIIHLHNGTLQLTSNTNGKVCFTIRL